MIKMKKTILFGFILLISGLANAQIIDKYGIRIGGGFSNQYWEYKNDMFSDLSDWKDNKLSLSVYLNAEKELTDFLSIRPEIGYLQKGYIDDIVFTTAEGEEINTTNKDVIFHNLSGNIGLKICPLDFAIKPYLIAGLRGDYMIDYKDVEVEFQGEKYELNKDIIEDFNKFTLSGLIGIGFEYQDLFYLDIEFNPAITKNFDDTGLSIKDRYVGVTIGLNINTLTKKSE
jgi:hypothetical protein